ncbi:MAG: hypothetical protein ACKO23_00285 [Gemmataceae bacterium]
MPNILPKRSIRFQFFNIALILSSILFLGCSSGGFNSVSGKVTVKGKPEKGVVVIFHPENAKLTSNRPSGVTGDDGSFTLTSGTDSGAPSGDYKVTFTWPEEYRLKNKAKAISTDEDRETMDRLNGRYSNVDTSQIKITIKSGKNSLPAFELQ